MVICKANTARYNTTLHTINETLFEQYTASIYPIENPKADISVYPNPFTHSTTISIDGMDIKDGSFKLYDSLGRLVRMENMNNNSLGFYKKDLDSGVYFFSVEDGGVLVSNGKLVVG
jgi:hypothetical protein